MTNITALQDKIVEFKDKSYVKFFMGNVGSGISTVMRDVAREQGVKKYLYIDCFDSGEVNDKDALRHFAFELRSWLVLNKHIRLEEFEILEDDFFTISRSVRGFLNHKKLPEFTIIFDNFEIYSTLHKYFFETLKDIVDVLFLKSKVKSIFIADGFFDEGEISSNLSKFYLTLFDDVNYVSGFRLEEISEVLESISKNSGVIAKQIFVSSGGNPRLVDRLLDIIGKNLEKNPDFVLKEDYFGQIIKDRKINYTLRSIWNSFPAQMQSIFKSISQGKYKFDEVDIFGINYLLGTNLVIKESDFKFDSNIKLLSAFISNDYKFTPETLSNSQSEVTDALSSQEFAVFTLLKENANKVVEKGQIAKIIWGNTERDKKKDWAIDQLMKRLRTKIGDNKAKTIQTIRGRGYKYSK